jgi:hypothetical protein
MDRPSVRIVCSIPRSCDFLRAGHDNNHRPTRSSVTKPDKPQPTRAEPGRQPFVAKRVPSAKVVSPRRGRFVSRPVPRTAAAGSHPAANASAQHPRRYLLSNEKDSCWPIDTSRVVTLCLLHYNTSPELKSLKKSLARRFCAYIELPSGVLDHPGRGSFTTFREAPRPRNEPAE